MVQRVTKEDCVRFAIRWLEPLKEGDSAVEFTRLAQEFRRDRGTISEGIRTAFEHGYVQLIRSGDDAEPDPFRYREQALETLLRDKFSTLKEAIVIGAGPRQLPSNQSEHGNILHERLGRTMAKFLAETVSFDLREGESFGFGSGRAVYHTVKNVSKFVRPYIRVKEVTLVSLCGNCQVKSGQPSSPILDANYNANALTTALDGPYSIVPVMAESIAPSGIDGLRMRAPFVTRPPNLALVGVGVLEGEHRFVNIDEIQAFVGPILEELKELNQLTRQLAAPDYCAVGDICNYLFRVPTPKNIKLSKDQQRAYEKIDELIVTINGRLLVITPQELATSKTRLLVVAGGRAKARAIRYLLSGPFGLNVEVLCTDRATARFLSEPFSD